MSSKLDREVDRFNNLLITNNLSTTAEVDISDRAGLILYFEATWTTCTLTVYAKSPADGVYYALVDTSGTAVTVTATQSRAVAIDDAIYAADVLKFVSDNAANNAIAVGGTGKS